ncbi:MAG: DNA replication and repair protein RecF [Chitinophagaceae bacterium]
MSPLQLKDITLLHFKNYPKISFTFTERIVGICGNNGIGKTNLLDAIHYLCFTKSYFGKADAQHVLNGASGFRVAGHLLRGNAGDAHVEQPTELICILRETGRKEFLLDGELYEKFAQHIGKFPCVFIAPDDVQIITGASEERRRFTDALLCQLDAQYLQHLMHYNKILQQRNGYLKTLAGTRTADLSLLDVYDEQLVNHGSYVYEQRTIFLRRLLPLVQSFYEQIAGTDEQVNIVYESQLLQASFALLLQQYREKDRMLQRTTQGIHRDDLSFVLKDQPFKSIASQGQRKSLLFALKLAEFEILKDSKGYPPFLLLDDVFEKLDEQRMSNLLNRVCVQNKGQVFITDTHKDRLVMALTALQQPFQVIELKN